jgi:hypothetical protein
MAELLAKLEGELNREGVERDRGVSVIVIRGEGAISPEERMSFTLSIAVSIRASTLEMRHSSKSPMMPKIAKKIIMTLILSLDDFLGLTTAGWPSYVTR